jgi:hypothetical protein
VPVRDRSRAQLLDTPGEIHMLVHSLQGRANDLLHRVPKGATNEGNLEALKDRFRNQQLAAGVDSGKKLPRFSRNPCNNFLQLSNVCPSRLLLTTQGPRTTREREIVRRRSRNRRHKKQLMLGGENTVNEALVQALEIQAVILAARSHKRSARRFWGSRLPPTCRIYTR